ncbi:MAG: hypothetical protein ACLPUO_03520 [Streptosporangiaceae bacterium]
MSGGDLLAQATAELYSADPDVFIEHRDLLAARARAAGDAPAAKRISGLRKPTRSAWVINRMVHAAPQTAEQLAALGQELRAAQRSLDGTAIRELSLRRRELIDALARQGFAVAGLHAPPAALRDEVTATLAAALADPQVHEQLAAGNLVRAVRAEGFGPAGPALTLVPPLPGEGRTPGSRRPAGRVAAAAGPAAPAAGRTGAAASRPASTGNRRSAAQGEAGRDRIDREHAAREDAPREHAERERAERERAEQERRRQAALSEAERAAAAADQVARAAAEAERDQESAVRRLEDQLADARQRLADARARGRQARAAQGRSRQALTRLQNEPSGRSAARHSR